MSTSATATHLSITNEAAIQLIIVAGRVLNPNTFDGTETGISIIGAALSDVIYSANDAPVIDNPVTSINIKRNTATIKTPFNEKSSSPTITSFSALLYQNTDSTLIITPTDAQLEVDSFSEIEFELFTMAGIEPLFRKTLAAGVAVVDGSIVIDLSKDELLIHGEHYFDISVTQDAKIQLLNGRIKVLATR